jgi:thiamine biosynthesis protein ThiI
MHTILVRYAEIGLKSRPIRKRFETILVNNLMDALMGEGIEALVTAQYGRIFVEAGDVDRASRALARVFGVASVSPVAGCSSDLEEMKRVIADLSQPLLSEGQSFAVRARRIGDHPYTSMDLGRELGSAVYLANEDKGIRVDLTDPDVVVHVEVRDRRAYLFSSSIPGPGGLPLGSQGKVLAVLEEERDALAAWLIMKRGCRTIAVGEEGSAAVGILKAWDPKLRVLPTQDLAEASRRYKALAVVFGYSLKDFEKMRNIDIPVPAFFPLVGMDEKEIEERLERIRGQ